MQITFQPLSGQRLFAYAKKSAILTASIVFVSLVLSKKEDTCSHPIKVSDSKNFTAIVNKMAEVKPIHKNIAHAPNVPTDTNQLKQSDWYKTVKDNIEKATYYIIADKDKRIFSSANIAQNLKANYNQTKFTLQPLQSFDKNQKANNQWQLNIDVSGLFADGQLLSAANQASNTSTNVDNIEYNFNNAYTIQYHNDSKGVRQNFLIKEKPAPNVHEIKISMKAEGNWVVNKVHNNELHFAKKNSKGELDSKIVYNDLKAWDANGKPLAAKMEVTDNNNFEIVTNVENASYPVTIDPLSSTASSILAIAGGSANNFFAGSIASAGDVNGDGYSDVIVGSVGVSGGAGAAYIFLGSASGLSASPATTLNGITALDSFGISVSSAGDINGDGFSDVIIGAKGVSSHTGAAYIYLGSASGISSSATPAVLNGISANDNFGTSVANAGDLDGDGFSDIIIGAYGVSTNKGAAYIYLGSASGIISGASASSTLNGASAGDRFGIAVASAGDIDGDGHSDVIVGAPLHSLATGAAYIYLGTNLTAPSATLSGPSLLSGFGLSVASAGDVNGDGYSDIIVGAAAVSSNTGAAYIYVGSSSGIANGASASTTLTGTSTNQFFGISVASAGDVNGDAFGDVIIGAIGVSSNAGAAYVYEGTSSGLSTTAALTINGAVAGDDFGASVASSGDINGDGYSDILVGAPNSSTATGTAYLYIGNPDGSISTNNLSIVGQLGGDRYGISVSSAGDINGDGYSDVLVGAIGYSGGNLNGAAYVYLGSANGLSTASPAILTPGLEEIGWDVASAGDINGDGYGDILIGAKFASGPGGPPNYNYGAVYVYLGNSSGVPTLSATLSGLNIGDVFGESISSAGDVNGDGYSDIIIGAPGVSTTNSLGGAAYLYMGSALGIQSTDVPIVLNGLAANAVFGANVAYAGDVNGDGYGDIIIGAPNLGSGYDIQDLTLGNDIGSSIGSAYVFYGSKTGIANNATANVTLTDAGVLDFGLSVSSAGDVNGDGFSDVIVGAPSGDNTGNPGTAEIFLGTAGGLSTSASTTLNGMSPGDEFGATVATAGDVNGDGYGDVIIRATMPSSGNPVTGAAYIYLGGPTGLSSTVATTISDEGANTFLETPGAGAAGNIMHRAVASAGDVNGDGYSDVIVGVYVDNSKTGKTYLYYGNNAVGRNASNVMKLYETDLTNPIAADNLTQNHFGLGLFAQSPFGTVKGRLVWEVEPNGTPFQGNPITNNVVTTGNQMTYSSIPAGGIELKSLIPKTSAKATKVRVRVQYVATAVTFGQVYSPWIYSQVYLLGGNLGILPLSVTLTANTSGQDILLNWKASEENDLSVYVVEHSLDGIKFDSLGTVASKGTTGTSSYDFTHYHPSVGIHYYRLREVNINGTKSYSETVSAKINGTIEFSIYPNPASDHIVITHSGITSNVARIMNSSGAIVGQYKLNSNGDQTTISLSGFAKGNYFVEVVNSGFAPKQITIQ